MQTEQARLAAYALASAALLAPVVAWPWLWHEAMPIEALGLGRMWLGSAAALLCAAAAADSAFVLRPRIRSVALCVVWVIAAMAVAALALRTETNGAWLLGLGFVAHSLRAARGLWKAAELRLWLSWGRDLIAAAALFGWGSLLP